MADSKVQKGTVSSGGANVATDEITEGGEQRHIQRTRIDGAGGKSVTDSASGTGGAISIGSTPSPNGTAILAANPNRVGFAIVNTGGAQLFLGLAATGLTAANGYRLNPGSSFGMQGPGVYRGVIHGITASGTADVRFLEW